MVIDETVLPKLWERVKGYVARFVSEYDSLAVATVNEKGQVRPDGTTITVDEDGTIHGADTVPIATESQVGKVKPDGTTIKVDSDGTIHGAAMGPHWEVVTDGEGNRRLAIVIPEEG